MSTGSSNPPYNVFTEKDVGNSSVTLQYQSITCMPAYRGTSFEELRLQDYQQGRKTAGAFGQSTFGAPATGGTGLFGQPAAPTTTQPTNSIFGSFGNNNAGAAAPAATGGAFGSFGQPAQPATGTTGTGLFGGGAFGQQQQQQPAQPQQPGAFGAFGQPQQPAQQQPAGGGLFGGGAFGAQNQQPKPFGAFGENANPWPSLIPSETHTAYCRSRGNYWTTKRIRRIRAGQPAAAAACCDWNRFIRPACSATAATGKCIRWLR